jgi:glycosyltransferase involved in cell wall biosynthesis
MDEGPALTLGNDEQSQIMVVAPRVSIGLPVFNGEKYLTEALDSILAQTFEDFELVVSDNASTDATREIINAYASKDRRIRLHHNERNIGAAANYNRVYQLSNGRYFKWIAHDDLSAPEFLERCVEILNTFSDVVLCYPKTIIIDDCGRTVGKYEDRLDLREEQPFDRLAHLLATVNLANAVFGLIRSNALKKTRLIGPFVASDYVLLMELCLLGKYYEVPEYLFFRRDHDKNVRKIPVKERGKWWDSSCQNSILSHRMKLLLEIFKAVNHINLGLYEKMLCYMQIRHWEIRRWRAMGGRYKAKIKEKFYLSSSR